MPLHDETIGVEKSDIKEKAHPEGVDAAAAWNQEAGPSGHCRQVRETEQARLPGRRQPELQPKY